MEGFAAHPHLSFRAKPDKPKLQAPLYLKTHHLSELLSNFLIIAPESPVSIFFSRFGI